MAINETKKYLGSSSELQDTWVSVPCSIGSFTEAGDACTDCLHALQHCTSCSWCNASSAVYCSLFLRTINKKGKNYAQTLENLQKEKIQLYRYEMIKKSLKEITLMQLNCFYI